MASSSFLQLIDIGLRAALFTRFSSILELPSINKGVVYFPKEIALREIAEKRGIAKLNFINVWRDGVDQDLDRGRTSVARRGMSMAYSGSGNTEMKNVKSIPVKLDYKVCFWSNNLEKINLVAEKYLWWRQDTSQLNMVFDNTFPLEPNLHFGALTYQTDIADKYEKGTIFVMEAPIQVDGWIFVSSEIKNIHSIKLTFYDRDSLETYSEIITEDSNQNIEKEAQLKLFELTITQ